MPKITSSSNRSKRTTTKPVTQGQNPQRANRQAVSQAKPTSSQQRSNRMRASTAKVTTSGGRSTAPGTPGANRNATPTGPRNPQSQVASARMRNTLRNSAMARTAANAAKTLGTIRSMMTPVGAAAAAMAPRPLASGTLKNKPTGATQGPAVPKRLTQAGIDKGSFDDAFRNARKAGKKEFSWKGKRYNTKLKGE